MDVLEISLTLGISELLSVAPHYHSWWLRLKSWLKLGRFLHLVLY